MRLHLSAPGSDLLRVSRLHLAVLWRMRGSAGLPPRALGLDAAGLRSARSGSGLLPLSLRPRLDGALLRRELSLHLGAGLV
jgi:hypothetical protein